MGDLRGYEKLVERIAKNISRVRKKHGITQEQMAEFGYSYRHYQRIESGTHSPSLPTLYRLAKTFKVEIKEFLK